MSDENEKTDEAQLLASPYPILWKKRNVWLKLGLVSQDLSGAMVAAAKANAIAEFREYEKFLTLPDGSPDTLRIQNEWKQIREDLVTGQFQWGGNCCSKYTASKAGCRQLIAGLLKEGGTPLCDDDLPIFCMDEGAAIGYLLQVIIRESECPKAKRPPANGKPAGHCILPTSGRHSSETRTTEV